jgi:hypothetical protein
VYELYSVTASIKCNISIVLWPLVSCVLFHSSL